ncbi:3'-5' exonuclease [Gottschalkiaceae bacterium SANA]|nr:3'-5' exonuclease [Gottschalkiaceae bacterium SANA]
MEYNTDQKRAIQTIADPLLVLAPAGSGKTAVLVARVEQAINAGIPATEILCVTFTNKAANEMKNRMSGRDTRGVTVKTFHGLCVQILRQEIHRLGHASEFGILDEEDVKEIAMEILRAEEFKTCKWSKRTIYFLIEQMKKKALEPDLPWPDGINPELGAKFIQIYNERIFDQRSLDFTDLMVMTHRIFRQFPEAVSTWQKRFTWIQVDEVQDTALQEYEILKALAAPEDRLALFGDFDQTIYSFRGSKPAVLLDRFRNDFQPIEEIHFVQNYRSTEAILQASQGVIAKLENREMQEMKGMLGEDGAPVFVGSFENKEAEYRYLAQSILALHKKYGIHYRNFGVLARTNWVCKEISQVFNQAEIPHYTIEEFKFFRRAEVKDALAWLQLVVNPWDLSAFKRLAKKDIAGVGEARMQQVLRLESKIGLRLTDFADESTIENHDPYGALREALSQGKLIIFDVEATGLDTARDEILELAGMKVDAFGAISTFHRYLRPSRPVGASEEVHGLSDAFLMEVGEEPREVIQDFMDFSKGCIWMGHNVGYDRAIVESHVERFKITNTLPYAYDTLDMSRRFFPNLGRYTLSNLYEVFDIQVKPTHRAIDDVGATVELFRHLWEAVDQYRLLRVDAVDQMGHLFEKFARQMTEFRADARKLRPALLFEKILEETGVRDRWIRRPDGKRREENLLELLRWMQAFDDEELSPMDALRELMVIAALGNETDRYRTSEDRVAVMTVHQAKGLEFDTVFLAGAREGIFPSARSMDPAAIDEERRLFFVAMTRAKKRLAITSHRVDNRGQFSHESRMIGDIPQKWIRRYQK